jgi:DNA-binding NtrC family response regulator
LTNAIATKEPKGSSVVKVLIVDDDAGLRLSLRSIIESELKFEILEACHGKEALEMVKANPVDIVLLDVDMPIMNGAEALVQLKEFNPGLIVIMMTAFASIPMAVEAVKKGAYQYLQKPVSTDDLLSSIRKGLEAHALISRVAASQPILMEQGRPFIGNNHQMQKVFHLIYRLSKVDTPVLIRGASGTGKELVARAIHFNSSRKEGKFVAINCSAIPENLFESELFGHEKGSFTGADQRKIGKLQFAEGGTLFLDEVGDLPLLMQVKLLRVLQEKVFTPVGANREIEMNVRVIAATNRPLEDMMKLGTFREDLYYRLNVIPIFLPSLADRLDDLDFLVPNFIKKFNDQHNRRMVGISVDALSILKKYDWPGNIRELENVIEHAFVMEPSNMITSKSLPDNLRSATGTVLPQVDHDEELFIQSSKPQAHGQLIVATNRFLNADGEESDFESDMDSEESENAAEFAGTSPGLDFNAEKEAFEKEFIIKALKFFKGRINQTALHANIPKKTLLRKIEKYGINTKDFLE